MKNAVIAILALSALAYSSDALTERPPTGCENVLCPSENCGDAVHFPNEIYCNSFCKCDWGQAIVVKCPAGLHFNPDLQVCDYPQTAGCTIIKSTTTTTITTNPNDDPLSTTTGAPNGCETVTSCPAINGEFALHLPNPVDCGSFCKCDWGRPIYFACPDGLHFNPILQVCDWPDKAGCNGETPATEGNRTTTPSSGENGGDDTSTPLTPTAGPNGCENVQCPTQNGEFALHLPNPQDCGSFCKCDWGQAIYFKCPDGLHFNAELQVCDWPAQAGCSDVDTTTSTGSGVTNATIGNGDDTPTPPTPTSTPTSGPNGCEYVRCPTQNGEFALHLPNPVDCGSFCKCDWGQAIYFKCPDGLHFNAELQVCDWPAQAGCSDVDTTTSTGSGVTNATGGNGDDTPTPPTPTSTPTSGPNGCEYVRCPTQNGEFALHLPNPVECGSFCKCDWGQAIYFKCPDGLHFNAELQVCDWPAQAGCSNVDTTTPAGPGVINTTVSNGDDPPTPTAGPNGCEYVRCPTQNGEFALHLPNPVDCGSFCKCDWGQAIYFKCPDGLHFNAELQVCDWPAQAGCSDVDTTSPNGGDIGGSSTTVLITDDTPTPPPTSGPNGCEYVRCPTQNGEFALHLPNPQDCGSFCKCDWGVAYHFNCPAGLHFNKEKQVCDWPQDAGCEEAKPTTVPSTPSQAEELPTTTTTPVDLKGCKNVVCPAENGKYALHLANPEDCSSFCKCDWGAVFYFDCPEGLHFNPQKQVCDYPYRAGCKVALPQAN